MRMNILVVDVTTLISITCFTGNVPKYEHVTAFDWDIWDHFESGIKKSKMNGGGEVFILLVD